MVWGTRFRYEMIFLLRLLFLYTASCSVLQLVGIVHSPYFLNILHNNDAIEARSLLIIALNVHQTLLPISTYIHSYINSDIQTPIVFLNEESYLYSHIPYLIQSFLHKKQCRCPLIWTWTLLHRIISKFSCILLTTPSSS